MEKNKKTIKFIRIIIIIFFIIYAALYFTEASGYIEYNNRKKTTLTNEQIKQFEQDVSKGKKIKLDNYINNNTQDYNNKISQLGSNISQKIGDITTLILRSTFKKISQLIE